MAFNPASDAVHLSLNGLAKGEFLTAFLNLPYLDGGTRLDWQNQVGSVFLELLKKIESITVLQTHVLQTTPVDH